MSCKQPLRLWGNCNELDLVKESNVWNTCTQICWWKNWSNHLCNSALWQRTANSMKYQFSQWPQHKSQESSGEEDTMRERDGKGGRVSVMLFPFVWCCETLRVRFLDTSGGDIAHFLHHSSHTTQYIQVRSRELSKETEKNRFKLQELKSSVMRNIFSIFWAFVRLSL